MVSSRPKKSSQIIYFVLVHIVTMQWFVRRDLLRSMNSVHCPIFKLFLFIDLALLSV